MQRLFLVALSAASLLSVFAVPQTASASGACFWWWKINTVTHASPFDCAHPPKPPWLGGPGHPPPGSVTSQPTHRPSAHPPSAPPLSTYPLRENTFSNTY